jgi:sigma-E factor negative regulatory protein RseC
MRQLVQVKRLLDPHHAEVFLQRQSACSGDCHKCSGCGAATETVQVVARNDIGAKPGDRVYVEAENRRMFKVIAVVYCVPLCLFFLGYFLGQALNFLPALLGGGLFLLGILGAVAYNRHIEKTAPVLYRICAFA